MMLQTMPEVLIAVMLSSQWKLTSNVLQDTKTMRFCYSIYSYMKRKSSIFNIYNLFFNRFVLVSIINIHFKEILNIICEF